MFDTDSQKSIIKVIGVGGGGCNAVKHMYNQNIDNVTYVVCNTDNQALHNSPVPRKITLGYEITKGAGAGNMPDVGRKCAEASAEELRHLFDDDTEMVFITAGMGGGTGTGAGPVVAQIAKEAGMLTIGIVTIPFLFEGEKKILKALDGAKEMQKHVDALLVINNERLTEIYPDLDFFNAFSKADDILTNAARSISEIITENCEVNVDFQDVKTTLRDSGSAIIATGYGEGENRVSNAIHNALNSPLLRAHDINTTKRLLLKFNYNPNTKNPFSTKEINQIRDFTANLTRSGSIDVKWGLKKDESLGDAIKMTILAAGIDITLKQDHSEENDKEQKEIIFHSPEDRETESSDDKKAREEEDKLRLMEIYGKETINRQSQDNAKVKYAVLRPSQFDDDRVIDMLDRTPAYKRNPRFNESLSQISKDNQTTPDAGIRQSGIIDKESENYGSSEGDSAQIVF